jgi:hypothetical protein
MKIVGDITIDDYLRSARALTPVVPSWFEFARSGYYIALFLAIVACGSILGGERGMNICLLGAGATYLSAWVFNMLTRQLLLNHYRAHAFIHNLGHAEYELDGDDLHFTGSTFDSIIPIASITGVTEVSGTTMLVFGNQSAFVIPRRITAGQVAPFVEEIRQRIAAR